MKKALRPMALQLIKETILAIRAARRELKMSQAELGRRVGIHQVSVARIERLKGLPSFETAFLMIAALNAERAKSQKPPLQPFQPLHKSA